MSSYIQTVLSLHASQQLQGSALPSMCCVQNVEGLHCVILHLCLEGLRKTKKTSVLAQDSK
jgi:hypothetical protein